jgi:hypothetical protein
MANNDALIAWLHKFDFKQENFNFDDGIIFENLISLLEGNAIEKENWATFMWDPVYFRKRVANAYFKLGCGSTLERVVELMSTYRVCADFNAPCWLTYRNRFVAMSITDCALFLEHWFMGTERKNLVL